jgi:hypothetical protein
VIGDNFYSSDARRIEEGAANRYTHGAVIKPNQAGTITAVRRAIEVAQRTNQIAITSHRSISTEETFISTLTCMYGEVCKGSTLGNRLFFSCAAMGSSELRSDQHVISRNDKNAKARAHLSTAQKDIRRHG